MEQNQQPPLLHVGTSQQARHRRSSSNNHTKTSQMGEATGRQLERHQASSTTPLRGRRGAHATKSYHSEFSDRWTRPGRLLQHRRSGEASPHHGEMISDEHFHDIHCHPRCHQRLQLPYVRNNNDRDRSFGLEEMKTTIKNMFTGSLSRYDQNKPKIERRGAAMQTRDLSRAKCHICKEFGHYK